MQPSPEAVKRTFPEIGPSAPGMRFALANGGGVAAETKPEPPRITRDEMRVDNILNEKKGEFVFLSDGTAVGWSVDIHYRQLGGTKRPFSSRSLSFHFLPIQCVMFII